MVKASKNLTTSTKKSICFKGKFSSYLSEPATIRSDHFEYFFYSKAYISNDALNRSDKALVKRPMEDDNGSLTPKKVKMDLDGLLESKINF